MSRNISKARRRVPATRLSADDLYVIIEAIDSYCARRSATSPDLGVLRDVVYNLAEKKDAAGRDLKSYALRLDRDDLEQVVVVLAEAQRSWVSNYDVDEALVTLSRINSSPVYAGAVS